MPAPQGLMSFPGIEKIISGSLTRSHGTSPGIATIQLDPQDSILKQIGTLTITFGGVSLSFPDSQIDVASFSRNRNGQIISLRIQTREWKWVFGEISGLYNERTNNGTLIPKLIKSPRELATMLAKEMGEKGPDLAAIDSLSRPRIDWIGANPASELSRLCDSLGCRIVISLRNQMKIVKLGVGKELPDSDVMQEGIGLNPASRPDILRLIGGPDVFQSMFLLEAVGEENDDWGTLKPIDELSYKPTGGWAKESPNGFWGVAPGQAKDVKEKCRQLALKTVYRLYRIKSQLDGSWRPPGTNIEVTDRKQIVLLPSQIVKVFPKDQDDPIRFKPAEITGSYYPESWAVNNTDLGTRYDGQFSIDAEPRRQLVEFAKPVFMYKAVPDDPSIANGPTHIEYAPADIRLTTSYNVQDKDTRQLIRSQQEVRLTGTVQGKPLVLPIVQDDVFRSYRATYQASRTFAINKLTGKEELRTMEVLLKKVIDNSDDFKRMADHYLQERARQFEDVVTGDREYAGIRSDIDLDGAIHQITYTVGRSTGATTRVSRNSEHDYDIPTYKDRQQQELNRFVPKPPPPPASQQKFTG